MPVYIDNHSTTRVDPRVMESLIAACEVHYGNPSSLHDEGQAAREMVESARLAVAKLAGCEPDEVYFTSGATESINWVLKGMMRTRAVELLHVVTCVTEHSAVLEACRYLETHGATVTRLAVDDEGKISLADLELVLKERPDILTLAHSNNEIGTIHPIEEIARLCRSYGVLLHVDGAQSLGKIPVFAREWGIDFLSCSGHKLYAPKGIGLLIIRRQNPPMRLTPLLHGGGQERGQRSGTLNVPGIAALGKACEICAEEMMEESQRVRQLRDHLWKCLEANSRAVLNGSLHDRLPGNLNVSFEGIAAQHLLPELRGSLCLSSGSACSANQSKPSHVLAAIGRSDELAQASLRFGIGRFNSREEIDFAAKCVTGVIDRLRQGKF